MELKPLRIIGQVLLVFPLVGCIVLLHLVIGLRPLSSGDFIKDYAKEIDVEAILGGEGSAFGEVYHETLDSIAAQTGLDKSYLEEIVNSEPVKEAVGEVLGSVVSYGLTGDETEKLSAEDLTRLVADNIDFAVEIAAENGYEITVEQRAEVLAVVESELPKYEQEINQAYEVVNEVIDSGETGGLVGDEGGSAMGVTDTKMVRAGLEVARVFFRPVMIVAVVAAIIVLVGLIILVRWSVFSGVFSLGLSALVGSALTLAVPAAAGFIIGMLRLSDIAMLVQPLMTPLTISAAIGLVAGVLVVILNRVFRKAWIKKKQGETVGGEVTREKVPKKAKGAEMKKKKN